MDIRATEWVKMTMTTTTNTWNDIFLTGEGFYCSYLDLPGRMKEAYDNEGMNFDPILLQFITDETAIVIGDGKKVGDADYLILNGDHREAMKAIGPDLEKLKQYFIDHKDQKGSTSDDVSL